MSITQHFVTFFAPGTFVDEQTTKKVSEWDVPAAVELAAQQTLRHNAKPHSFQFFTKSNDGESLDSKETARSPLYYLGGLELDRDVFLEILADIDKMKEQGILPSNSGTDKSYPLCDGRTVNLSAMCVMFYKEHDNNRILQFNIEANTETGDRLIVNSNSYRTVRFLGETDIVLQPDDVIEPAENNLALDPTTTVESKVVAA